MTVSAPTPDFSQYRASTNPHPHSDPEADKYARAFARGLMGLQRDDYGLIYDEDYRTGLANYFKLAPALSSSKIKSLSVARDAALAAWDASLLAPVHQQASLWNEVIDAADRLRKAQIDAHTELAGEQEGS